jgi:hypothetical protein
MWRDICLANRDALLVALRQYHDDLGALAAAIEKGDGKWLCETFTRAKHTRAALNKKYDVRLVWIPGVCCLFPIDPGILSIRFPDNLP